MTPAMALPKPMTEKEAYAYLGWAEEGGKPNPFVLPLCGETEEVWFVTYCDPCTMAGVARLGAVEAGCGCCRRLFTRIVGK